MEDRRLAAIMFTDIVGYTALMGSDEDKAFEMLRKNREIHKSCIEKHNGTLIKEVGDGMLISFNLASDAVRCAKDIQEEAMNQQIPLKIGIHEGEMVFEGADVLGDGVNVASRLQEMSDEGTIIISDAVNRDIKNKPGIETRFIKEVSLKNVDEPVKVFKVITDLEKEEIAKDKKQIANKYQIAKRKNLQALLYIILASIIVLAVIWKFFLGPDQQSTPDSQLSKSIAVLPFRNDSPDQENEYVCNGMMEELLTHLQKIADLRVTSRTSVEKYRNTQKDLREIAEELGVAFVVEGSVRKAGDNLRITAQLIAAQSDDHLWAETYDGKYTDEIFEFQSNTAKQIASSLNAVIKPEEEKRIKKIPTDHLDAYDLYIRAEHELLSYFKNRDDTFLKSAHNLIDQALEIDPKFANALSIKASIYAAEGNSDSALLYADRAILIDPEYSESYLIKGEVYHGTGKYDLALENYQKAYELSSEMSLWGYIALARAYGMQSNFTMSFSMYAKATEFEEVHLPTVYNLMGMSFLAIGDYEYARKYMLAGFEGNRGQCIHMPLYSYLFLGEGNIQKAQHVTDSLCMVTDSKICERFCPVAQIVCKHSQGQYEKVIDLYEKAGDVGFLNDLITCYYIHAKWKLGDKNEAKKLFDQLLRKPDIFNIDNIDYWSRLYALTGVFATLGEEERALELLGNHPRETLSFGRGDYIIIDPLFENLQNNTKFKAIVKEHEDKKKLIRAEVRAMIERGEIDL
jgi:adenylate cyclase